MARHSQYPPLDLRHRPFGWRKVRLQEPVKRPLPIGACQPGSDAKGVVLIGGAAFIRIASAPDRRIDLGNDRTPRRHLPSVEWPKMHPIDTVTTNKSQPRNPG